VADGLSAASTARTTQGKSLSAQAGTIFAVTHPEPAAMETSVSARPSPCKINKKKTPVFMELSDKALRLIGLTVLASMDNKKIQDDSDPPCNNSNPGGYGRPRLTTEAGRKAVKAPVIALRSKQSTP
jgi:hypothetical protein